MTYWPNPLDNIGSPQGWICPKCGGVMWPNFPTCFYCKPTIVTTIANIGTGACPHCHFAHTQDVDCGGRKPL